MEEAIKSAFKFEKYNILRSVISRKSDETPKSLQISFEPKGTHFKEDGRFELSLDIRIEDEDKSLLIEVETVASYSLEGEVSDKMLHSFFYINAPAILFPYIRAYIAALTTLSGMSPINLPTLNLTQLAPELEKNTHWV
ncbi:MAG TPA: protein export chaperone secb [Prolixibacteraceae bacterium]|nr:protein export chaperone secb [Prolixibacteraceae bacterium]